MRSQVIHDEIVVEREPKNTQNTSSGNPAAKRVKTSHNFGVDTANIPDNRAFPHLHTLFDKLSQTFINNADIGPQRLTRNLRRYLHRRTVENICEEKLREWRLKFQQIALTLDLLMSREPCLDPVERLTLEDLLARPPMFAYVLAPRLVSTLKKLEGREVSNIYSEFLNFVRQPWDLDPQLPAHSVNMSIKPGDAQPSPSIHDNPFPALKLTIEGFASEKAHLRILKQHAAKVAQKAVEKIYIHRLEFVPNHKEFEKKILTHKIVIDCPDYHRFPPTNHHHINMQKSHEIKPVGNEPQFHIMVIQTCNTPKDDEEIKKLWLKHRRGGIVPAGFQEWYAGAQVFNVFDKVDMLRTQLSILVDTLMDSLVYRKLILRGTGIPSEGKIVGFSGNVWVPGQGVWREYRNAHKWVNSVEQADLREDAEAAAETWLAVLEQLFPEMVRTWRSNTLGSKHTRKPGCAAPCGFHGCAVTAFATMCYAAGIHFDSSDLGFTVGIRAFRPDHEPPGAYQFVYPSLRLVGSPLDHCGVIMRQSTGAITLWPAWRIAHGSSIDVRETNNIPGDLGQTVSLALVQKAPMFTFCGNSKLSSVLDLQAMGDYYDRPLLQHSELNKRC